MGKMYDEYKICQTRGHQKSGRIGMTDGSTWEVCRHCGTSFRYVTVIKEINIPSHDS